MRIWDLPPEALCRRHLLGEHVELHALWSIITRDKKGYSNHPETRRWRGKLMALFQRHQRLVREFERRGYNHHSPLDQSLAVGASIQDELVDSVEEQKRILAGKGCGCRV